VDGTEVGYVVDASDHTEINFMVRDDCILNTHPLRIVISSEGITIVLSSTTRTGRYIT